MSDSYARVMRPADEPGNRRRTRSGPAGPAGTVTSSTVSSSTVSSTTVSSSTGPRPQAVAARPKRGPAGSGTGGSMSTEDAATPAEATFAAAMASFRAGRAAQDERDLLFEDVPAPKRLAPFATAIAATVQRDGADVAWGRLVLLYDPDGQEGWDGVFRLVAYIRAEVEPEIAAAPLLGGGGWGGLAEGGAGRARTGLRGPERHGDQGDHGRLRGQAGRDPAHRVRAARLLVSRRARERQGAQGQ